MMKYEKEDCHCVLLTDSTILNAKPVPKNRKLQ